MLGKQAKVAMISQLEAEVADLKKKLEAEVWQHSACLSIAEGAPGWDAFRHLSPAGQAVQALRRVNADLYAALEALSTTVEMAGYKWLRKALESELSLAKAALAKARGGSSDPSG